MALGRDPIKRREFRKKKIHENWRPNGKGSRGRSNKTKSSIFHEPDNSVATKYRSNSRGNKSERYVPIQILRHLGIYKANDQSAVKKKKKEFEKLLNLLQKYSKKWGGGSGCIQELLKNIGH